MSVVIAAGAVAAGVIHYNQGFYERKIDNIQGYIDRLKPHLDELQTLEGQMEKGWQGPEAEEAGRLLVQQINAVKNAIDSLESLKSVYVDGNGKIQQLKSTVTESVQESKSAVDALGIKA